MSCASGYQMARHAKAVSFVFLAVTLAALAGCGSSSGGSGGANPRAVIESSTLSGTLPLTVAFDGTASSAESEATIASYLWDFGDGSQSIDAVTSHTYTSAGTYRVSLTVMDTQALSGEARVSVTVTQSLGAPVALLAASAHSGIEPLSVSFDSSGSHDPDGTIVSYEWSFGDGATSSAAAPSHTFSAGVHTVILTVTDDSGATGQDSTLVAVASYDDEVVRLVNVERSSSHLPPIKDEAHLVSAALRHSTDMANNMVDYISHTGTDGSTYDQRIGDAGYTGWTAIAENIAAGYSTPSAVIAGWMASSGHRANILSTNCREIGVSYVYAAAGYQHFWTQDFGARTSVFPVVINREEFSTTSATVSLYIHGSGWAEQMQVSNNADFAGAAWEPYSETKSWDLFSGLGTKTVHLKLKRGTTEVVSSDTIARVES